MEENMNTQPETPVLQETPAQQQEADAREERLAQREKEVARREMRSRALASLTERNLPQELADLLDYTDEARCTASLTSVQRVWQQAVQRGVQSRVAGTAPRTGAGRSARSTMREAISAYYSK